MTSTRARTARLRATITVALLTVVVAACSADDADPLAAVPVVSTDVSDAADFTARDDVSESAEGRTPAADQGDSATPEGSDISADETVQGSTGSRDDASDNDAVSSDPAEAGDDSSNSSGAESEPNSDSTAESGDESDPALLTPEELEAGEAGPIDADELRDIVEVAEEENRNRPEAEPGEIDLANADVTFETRFLGGRISGATGSENVTIGSIVAYSLVTDSDDILTLDGTPLRAPTNADSVQLVFRADEVGVFTLLLEDSGTPLLELVVG